MSATTPDAATPASSTTARPRRPRVPFWAQVFLGLALGVVLGFVARQFDQAWLAETLKTVGGIFVQLLKVIVVPLVLTAIIVSIANLRTFPCIPEREAAGTLRIHGAYFAIRDGVLHVMDESGAFAPA